MSFFSQSLKIHSNRRFINLLQTLFKPNPPRHPSPHTFNLGPLIHAFSRKGQHFQVAINSLQEGGLEKDFLGLAAELGAPQRGQGRALGGETGELTDRLANHDINYGSEGRHGDHVADDAQQAGPHHLGDLLLGVALGVEPASALQLDLHLALCQLIVNPLLEVDPEPDAAGHCRGRLLGLDSRVGQLQAAGPFVLVEVEQHHLLELVGLVVDVDRVVVPVEPFEHGLH
jgi:hypothetical protein